MDLIKVFVPTFIIGMVIDFIWIGVLAGGFYKTQLAGMIRATKDFTAGHWSAAALVYVAIVGGIMFFVLPRSSSVSQAALYGAIFGLISYAIYELTNYSLLLGWPSKIVFVDIAWGVVLCALLSMVAYQCKAWFS
jgi:uncharacterized membrane protein